MITHRAVNGYAATWLRLALLESEAEEDLPGAR